MDPRPFALLDRDGTIIVEKHYLSDPAQVELCEGAAQGLRLLRDAGFGLVVVTNQSGIGRGYFDRHRVDAVHERLGALLLEQGVRLDGVFVCPHTPDDHCRCRKPNVGLAVDAAEALGFDLSRSFVVGDKGSDIELGHRLGVPTILVRTGYGARYTRDTHCQPHFIEADLRAAARRMVSCANEAGPVTGAIASAGSAEGTS